jgi:hypothetical protein
MYMMDLINETTNSNEIKAKVAKAIYSLTNAAMNESFNWYYDADKIVISVKDLPIMFYLDADIDLDEWN